MPWNGSGQFNRTDGTRTGATVWAQAKAAGVKIVTIGHDTHDEDLASGLEACWNRNGENALTADVSAGGFSITNLADGAAAGEALAYGQDGALFVSTDGGATAAPVLVLWRNSATPAADDLLGELRFDGEDSAGNLQEYANIQAQIAAATSTSESGRLLFSLMQSGTERIVFRLGINECRVTSWDSGADAAPTLSLHRNSSSPADNDALAVIDFDGEDDGSTQTTFARVGAIALDVTDATEDGALTLSAMTGGSLTEIQRVVGDGVAIGKTAFDDGASAGIELAPAGVVRITRDDDVCMAINRLTSDGTLVSFAQSGSVEGTISVSGTTVSYGTFTGNHWGQWATDSAPDDEPPPGTVLVTTDEEYVHGTVKPQLCKVAISHKRADRRVYGVYAGPANPRFHVYALGTAMVRVIGRAEGGDLLRTSDIPGVAEVQDDDIVRASTLGKVTRGNPEPGEKLVAAVLYSG